MKRIVLLLIILAPFLSFSQEMKIKSDGVRINFITNIQNTSGSIAGFAASIKFDMNDLSHSKIKGTVDVNTLTTKNKKRDEHLKSSDYFEAVKYPKIKFESASFVKKGDQFIMEGTLTIRDVKRKEKIIFSLENNVFKGESTIQAAHYGIFDDKKPEKTNVKISFVVPVM